MTSKFGDRVNLLRNQRLDHNETLVVRDDPFNYIELANGGLMGASEGVVSAPVATFEDLGPGLKVLRFGEMVLFGAKNIAGKDNLPHAAADRAKGGILHFIPTAPKQTQTIVNIATYSGSAGVLWWRVGQVEAVLGNRRQWKPGYPDGKMVATWTRLVSRAFFAVTPNFASPPTDGETWSRLGRFDWTDAGNPPVVTFCHAFEPGYAKSSGAALAAKFWLGQTMMANRDVASNDGRSYATARAVSLLSNLLLKVMSGAHAFNATTGEVTTPGALGFLDAFTRGIYELDRDLTTAEAVIGEYATTLTTHTEDIAALATSDARLLKLFNTAALYTFRRTSGGTNQKSGLRVAADMTTNINHSATGTHKFYFVPGGLVHEDKVAVQVSIETVSGDYGRISYEWKGPYELWVYTFNNADALTSGIAFSMTLIATTAVSPSALD